MERIYQNKSVGVVLNSLTLEVCNFKGKPMIGFVIRNKVKKEKYIILGIMEKKEAIFNLYCSSGQKGGCFTFQLQTEMYRYYFL